MKAHTILLLGSGELGKELTIALQRLGQTVVAVDKYANAPAMQVADHFAVIDMLDERALSHLVEQYKPDRIVPEIEAIRTEKLLEFERQGYTVVPSAQATHFTMNRKAIRNLAAEDLGINTAKYAYAQTLEEFQQAVSSIGFPCIAKPLMSSSGKGQSTLRKTEDILSAWQYALEGSRGDVQEVIVEEFIPFDFEITLLTVSQKNGNTLFCPAIGHRQENGDYRESWQPQPVSDHLLLRAQDMARQVTEALGGAGLWGVEFFIGKEEVWFSELSPRPHDTGMVTLAGTQNLNEFELHARAILGLPVPSIHLERSGINRAIVSEFQGTSFTFEDVAAFLTHPNTDIRLFGKPEARIGRRMGIQLLSFPNSSMDVEAMKAALSACGEVEVVKNHS